MYCLAKLQLFFDTLGRWPWLIQMCIFLNHLHLLLDVVGVKLDHEAHR